MSTKILLVIEDSVVRATDKRMQRLREMTRIVNERAKEWLERGGCGALTLLLAEGMKLKVYQVGPEVLKEPPQIVVRYSSEPLPMCGICGWPIPQEAATELHNEELCHTVCGLMENR